jgi:hypothetical protein
MKKCYIININITQTFKKGVIMTNTKTNKKYYTSESSRGSSTSHGFANDTIVKVWDSKKSRDAYLANVENISAVAIKKCDVTKNATNWSMSQNCELKPKPFTAERWVVMSWDSDVEQGEKPEGYLGYVDYGVYEERQATSLF